MGLLANGAHGDAVGEQTHLVQLHRTPRLQRRVHGGRVFRLHADDLDARPERLDVGRDAGDQAAATDGHEDGVHPVAVLAQDLEPDRALAGDHVGVLEGMDEDQTVALRHGMGPRERLVDGNPVQDDVPTEPRDGVGFDSRRRGGHDDDGSQTQRGRRERHALGVIARRRADHAVAAHVLVEVGDLVVRAPDLEREDRLQVLALQQHVVADLLGQQIHPLEGSLPGHVVDVRPKNPLQIGLRHGRDPFRCRRMEDRGVHMAASWRHYKISRREPASPRGGWRATVQPPSTAMTWPVTKDASSEARKHRTDATSSGAP